MRTLPIVVLTFLAMGAPKILESQAIADSKLGLAVVAEAGRASVRPGEPIVLRLTFRNTSSGDFRLPDEILPAPYDYWYLKLQDAANGKTFTGVSTRPMGAAPEPGEIRPALMRAGDVKTLSVPFPEFAFVQGDMDFQAARNVWFPQRSNSAAFALPVGTYDVRVNVRFRSFPNRPNLPPEIQAAQAALQNNPIPLWAGGEIQSSSTRISVRADAVVQEAETIAIVKDTAVSVLDVLKEIEADGALASLRRHAGLANDLRAIGDAANAIRNSDSKDANTARSEGQSLSGAVAQAAVRALEISRRTNESADDRAKAGQLAMRLRRFPALGPLLLGSTN